MLHGEADKATEGLQAVGSQQGLSWELFREGSNHSIYVVDGSVRIIVPRHNDINEVTAESILRRVEDAKQGGDDD